MKIIDLDKPKEPDVLGEEFRAGAEENSAGTMIGGQTRRRIRHRSSSHARTLSKKGGSVKASQCSDYLIYCSFEHKAVT